MAIFYVPVPWLTSMDKDRKFCSTPLSIYVLASTVLGFVLYVSFHAPHVNCDLASPLDWWTKESTSFNSICVKLQASIPKIVMCDANARAPRCDGVFVDDHGLAAPSPASRYFKI
eukprot:8893667-Karenia_brevis.AAC.1